MPDRRSPLVSSVCNVLEPHGWATSLGQAVRTLILTG